MLMKILNCHPRHAGTRIFLLLLTLAMQLAGSQIFIAPDGNDANPGTLSNPKATVTAALNLVAPGDSILVRGGTYIHNSTITIGSAYTGSDSLRYYLLAHENERPLFDFSTSNFGLRGFRVNASYWIIRGLDIKGAGDNGMQISGGSYNIIDNCTFFENRDTGLQLSSGAAYNQILNCDSYYNADPPDYGDADGFAPKLDVGTGNYFYGCRAWGNCDDGWDGYMRGANDVTTTLDSCWTWGNGYLPDGSDPGPQANGNGFKMGGGDNSNADSLMHHFQLTNCLAFNNKVKGFDQNNNEGSMTLLNCSGYGNLVANFRISRELNAGQFLTVKNSVSHAGLVQLGDFAIQETNSWMNGISVDDDDFVSVSPLLADNPRQADGSLPEIDFMHLAAGSDLIDSGTDIGIWFSGSAPDPGAFEYIQPDAIEENLVFHTGFRLDQNFPNPFNPTTMLSYYLPESCDVRMVVLDLLGREILTLDDAHRGAGHHSVSWDGKNSQGLAVAGGVYFYRLEASGTSVTNKMLLLK